MMQGLRTVLAAGGLLFASLATQTALAQKAGGTLQMPGFASPASMSIHEESDDRGRYSADGRLQ